MGSCDLYMKRGEYGGEPFSGYLREEDRRERDFMSGGTCCGLETGGSGEYMWNWEDDFRFALPTVRMKNAASVSTEIAHFQLSRTAEP